MWNRIKKAWQVLTNNEYSDYYLFDTYFGKMHKIDNYKSTGNIYWFYIDRAMKNFRIRYGHITISGKIDHTISLRKFFRSFIKPEDLKEENK